MDINWTEVYGDAVRPPLVYEPDRHRGEARECYSGNNLPPCEWSQRETANCPQFQEAALEVQATWNWQERVWEHYEPAKACRAVYCAKHYDNVADAECAHAYHCPEEGL